jgi:hypothetical protein
MWDLHTSTYEDYCVQTQNLFLIIQFMNMQVSTNKNFLDIFQLQVRNKYASTHNVMIFASDSNFT